MKIRPFHVNISIAYIFFILITCSQSTYGQRNRYGMVLSGEEGSYAIKDKNEICNIIDCDSLPLDVYERYNYLPDQITPEDIAYCTTTSYTFKTYSTHTLTMEIDIPALTSGPHPFIIYVHGGGWSSGGVTTFSNHSRYLASKGIAGVRITYSLTGQNGNFDLGMQELTDAFTFIQEHANEWGLDLDRFGYAAGSAGVPLAALKSMQQPTCRLFMGFYGLYDFQHNLAGSFGKTSSYLVNYPNIDDRDVISAINHIPTENIPVVRLFHGTADHTISYLQSQAFNDSIINKGGDSKFVVYKFYDHSLLNKGFSDKYEEAVINMYKIAKDVFKVSDIPPLNPHNLRVEHTIAGSLGIEISEALTATGKVASDITDTLFISGAATMTLADCQAVKTSLIGASTMDLTNAKFADDAIPSQPSTGTGVYGAFASNSNLVHVILPYTLKEVGTRAFHNCSEIVTANLPDCVEKIGIYSFFNCGLLEMSELPDNLTYIGDGAFHSCKNIALSTLPESLVTLGDGLGPAGAGAFYGATRISISEIPDKVTVIGPDVFRACTQLSSMTFPAGLTSIGVRAFHTCTGLRNFYFKGTTPPAANTTGTTAAFYNIPTSTLNAITCHVPMDSKTNYNTLEPWSLMNIVDDFTATQKETQHHTVKVFIRDEQLIVHDITVGEKYTLYDATGQLQTKGIGENNNLNINMINHGMYILKIGNESVKVVY